MFVDMGEGGGGLETPQNCLHNIWMFPNRGHYYLISNFLEYYETTASKLLRANHEPGPKCRCLECNQLKLLEDKWIIKLGTFYGDGLNSRNEIKSKARGNWNKHSPPRPPLFLTKGKCKIPHPTQLISFFFHLLGVARSTSKQTFCRYFHILNLIWVSTSK